MKLWPSFKRAQGILIFKQHFLVLFLFWFVIGENKYSVIQTPMNLTRQVRLASNSTLHLTPAKHQNYRTEPLFFLFPFPSFPSSSFPPFFCGVADGTDPHECQASNLYQLYSQPLNLKKKFKKIFLSCLCWAPPCEALQFLAGGIPGLGRLCRLIPVFTRWLSVVTLSQRMWA